MSPQIRHQHGENIFALRSSSLCHRHCNQIRLNSSMHSSKDMRVILSEEDIVELIVCHLSHNFNLLVWWIRWRCLTHRTGPVILLGIIWANRVGCWRSLSSTKNAVGEREGGVASVRAAPNSLGFRFGSSVGGVITEEATTVVGCFLTSC